MTRQLEADSERRSARRHKAIVAAVEYALEQAVARAGGQMTGFAYKSNGGPGLMVLKVHLAGRAQVAFIGGEDLGSCLIKAVREASQDKLRWKDDRYVGQS